MPDNENLRSVSINDLLNGFEGKRLCFIVPSYQRGYRWEAAQVEKLLDDLYDFCVLKSQSNPFVGSFYCLQPIVVKPLSLNDVELKMGPNYDTKDNYLYYEIVDGQQRMTTLYILLKKLLRDSEPFDIEYERDRYCNFNRKHILEGILHITERKENIKYADGYFIIQTFEIINEWIKNKKSLTGNNALISDLERTVCNDTKVIWYELEINADCYSVFKNINNGKIPLTDAELVKAMLLNSKHFATGANNEIVKQEQNRYARLWDEIQKELGKAELWSFITGGSQVEIPTRIDFLIELIVKTDDISYQGRGDHKFFSYFEDKLNSADDKKEYIESVFEKLRVCFRTIQDWNDDYKLHNYIGYLLTYLDKGIGPRITKIIELQNSYNTMSKSSFNDHLIEEIRDHFTNNSIETINYQDDRKKTEKLLMLFNIEELNEIKQKFNFDVEGKGWSIEHIKAQHSEIVQKERTIRIAYMQKEKESLEIKKNNCNDPQMIAMIDDLLNDIDAFLSNQNSTDNDFTNLAEVIDYLIDGFDADAMHGLGNLALLSAGDNSSFSNNPFYTKREMMNDWLKDPAKNIPHSTDKAFHKMYSQQSYTLDFTRWSKKDYDDMFARQKELLVINDVNSVIKGFIKER